MKESRDNGRQQTHTRWGLVHVAFDDISLLTLGCSAVPMARCDGPSNVSLRGLHAESHNSVIAISLDSVFLVILLSIVHRKMLKPWFLHGSWKPSLLQ